MVVLAVLVNSGNMTISVTLIISRNSTITVLHSCQLTKLLTLTCDPCWELCPLSLHVFTLPACLYLLLKMAHLQGSLILSPVV